MGVAVYGCLEQNVQETKLTSTNVNRTYWASTTVTTGRTRASYVKVKIGHSPFSNIKQTNITVKFLGKTQ